MAKGHRGKMGGKGKPGLKLKGDMHGGKTEMGKRLGGKKAMAK